MFGKIWNDSYSVCVYVCLWANSFSGPWAQFHVCIKRKLMLRKCQQLMKSSWVQQGQAVTLKAHFYLCCCPFLWSRKFPCKIKHAHFIVSDNLWLVGWVAKVFHFSRITSSHQQLYFKQSEPDKKMKTKHESVFYLSFTARLTCCLSLALFQPSFPFTAFKNYKCKLCSNHFTVATSNLSRQACTQAGYLSCCVNLCICFLVRLPLYWIIHWQTYI